MVKYAFTIPNDSKPDHRAETFVRKKTVVADETPTAPLKTAATHLHDKAIPASATNAQVSPVRLPRVREGSPHLRHRSL